jgi:hypothetical protein
MAAHTYRGKLGSVDHIVELEIDHKVYTCDPHDVRTHLVRLTIDRDKLLAIVGRRACLSKRGYAQTVKGAIRVRKVR